MSTSPQPKIAQNLAVRTLGLLVAVAAVFGGYRYWQGLSEDVGGIGAADSFGMIAAIERKGGEGQEAVIFRPDGSILCNKGYQKGDNDRDLAWQPDGNRLFFVKDREGEGSNVYRWNPAKDEPAERKTVGTRNRGNIAFGTEDIERDIALLTSGGFVVEFDPRSASTRQVLPPVADEIAKEEEGGSQGQFGALYSRFGESFRLARWCKGRDYIATVMRREGGDGEALVLQKIEGSPEPPAALVAGEKIEIDVNPKTGDIVFAVQNFQFTDPQNIPEEYKKDNRQVVPFRHAMFVLDPANPKAPVLLFSSKNDKHVLGSPSVSPDGSTVMATVGTYKDGSLLPFGLLAMPVRDRGFETASPLARGEIYEPSWSPDGGTIVFARRSPGGKRDIFTVAKDGRGERNLSGGRGDFASPRFSPQLAPPGT